MTTSGIPPTEVKIAGAFAYKDSNNTVGVPTADGNNGGILLQGDKSNYRAILVALQGVAAIPVSVSEKEREYVPVGVTTSVAKEANAGASPKK